MKANWVLMAWLTIGIIAAILSGLLVNPYLTHARQMPPPHPYPLDVVFWIVVFMIVQVGAVLVIIKPKHASRSIWRALLIALVSLGTLEFAISSAMHMPPAYRFYLYWLLAFLGASITWLAWSIVSAIRTPSTGA